MLESYWPEISAFFQVLFIDIVLAGDNAVVVGMAAAGIPAARRAKVILAGIGAAVVLRIFFALGATQLLQIVGLQLAGGILLMWVCWKMYRELMTSREEQAQAAAIAEDMDSPLVPVPSTEKTFAQAMWQIVVADVSMSLDNVLAVAGAAMEHPRVLFLGLLISVALMGAAASIIARLLSRYHWIAWIGLLIIFYVAIEMIWNGAGAVACAGVSPIACTEGLGGLILSTMSSAK
jgi:YjbE family integral membrane protein